MTRGPDDLRDLAAAYALGALEPDEARAFEAAMAASPELAREVAEYREVNALVALDATAQPAPDLRARVLARALQPAQPAVPAPRRDQPWLRLALAASVTGMLAVSAGWWSTRTQLVRRDATIAALQDTLQARDQRLTLRESELNAILDPNVLLARLGDPGTPQPVVQLFWNQKSHQLLLHAFQLKPAAARRAYQLWFIPRQGAPIASITFNTENGGHGLVQAIPVPTGLELQAAAITEEPDGGSPQPTTPILLLGPLPAAES